jgi:hypothetical protein
MERRSLLLTQPHALEWVTETLAEPGPGERFSTAISPERPALTAPRYTNTSAASAVSTTPPAASRVRW